MNLGKVTFEGDRATLRFERILKHPPEVVWAAITDPEQLSEWYLTKARIDGRPGGSIDFVAGVSQFHVTGRILEWDPPRLFEHEWNVEPRPELPSGEKAIISWEVLPSGKDSLLIMTHRNLTRGTSQGFAPGSHAYLNRLEAQLDGETLPDFISSVRELRPMYSREMSKASQFIDDCSFRLRLGQRCAQSEKEYLYLISLYEKRKTLDLAKKLQLSPETPVYVINPPKGLKLGLKIVKKLEPGAAVLLFANDTKALSEFAESAISLAKADQLSWIAYPKAGKLGTDLNRDKLFEHLKPKGIEGVRLISIDDTWSAMRFRPAHGR